MIKCNCTEADLCYWHNRMQELRDMASEIERAMEMAVFVKDNRHPDFCAPFPNPRAETNEPARRKRIAPIVRQAQVFTPKGS